MLRNFFVFIAAFGLILNIAFAEETKLEPKLSFSGLIISDMWYSRTEKTKNESDIKVTDAQLNADIELGNKAVGKIIFLFDDTLNQPDEKLSIDEAWVRITATDKLGVTIGKIYLPFGDRSTFLISDQLILNAAEYSQSAISADYKLDENFMFKTFIFNADKQKYPKVNDHIRDFGASCEYSKDKFFASFSLISNVADKIGASIFADSYLNRGTGLDISVKYSFDKFSFIGEYAGSIRKVEYSLNGIANNVKLNAYNIEANYQYSEKTSFALRIEKSTKKDSSVQKEKITNFAFGSSYMLFQNTTLMAEYLHSWEDIAGADKDIDTISGRISFSF